MPVAQLRRAQAYVGLTAPLSIAARYTLTDGVDLSYVCPSWTALSNVAARVIYSCSMIAIRDVEIQGPLLERLAA